MSFDVSLATQYVALKSKEWATKAVSESTTAKLLIAAGQVQLGIKGEAPLLLMDVDCVLQDVTSSCGRVSHGDVRLTDKKIIVRIIADKVDFCPKVLTNKYAAYAIGAGSQPDAPMDNSFMDKIIGERLAKFQYKIEVLNWQGNTSSADIDLKIYNGLIKQISSGDFVDINSYKTTVLDRLQESHLKMPVRIRKQADYRIFLGEDMFDQYIADLANKNIFKPTDDMKLFGTNATLVPTSGLNETNRIVATRISNLTLGMDGLNEEEKVKFFYSNEVEKIYSDMFTSSGICIAYETEAGLGDYNITTAPPTTTTTTTV